MKSRFDKALVERRLAASRSQAEGLIKLGRVKLNGVINKKAGLIVTELDKIDVANGVNYVSRAGLKLASVADKLGLDFRSKIVLDVGSSTGGFTDFALRHGAKKVIAVDVGTNQMHPNLRTDARIELHEQTDIRDFAPDKGSRVDLVLADVSFISLREIFPSITNIANKNTEIVAMVKPQFEASHSYLKHKGVIKNERLRRQILKDFETWAKQHYVIINKADSSVAGEKGNVERFYLLKLSS